MLATTTRREWISAAASAAALGAAPETVRLPKKVRLAVLGLDGHPNEVIRPLPQLPDVEVVGLFDPNPKKVASFAKLPRLAGARIYKDPAEMLDKEKPDVVAVCNSNGERARGILECTERKIHVIAEKPLAIERAELGKIRRSVERNRVKLSMLLGMRFSPPYRALRRIVESGELGEVAQIGAQKSYKVADRPEWQRRRSTYGGTIPWIGIHMVDLMLFTSGRQFTEVAAFQSHIGFPELGDMENVVGCLFRMDNGGVATLRMDYLRPETAPTHGDDRLRLAGTKGVAEHQAATGVTLMTAGRKPETIAQLPPAGSVFVDFLESVYNHKPPELPLEDIYRACEIVLGAREAAEEHRFVKLVS